MMRKACAVLLTVSALPFLFAANTGCSFHAPLSNSTSNSYVCSCTCGPAMRHLEVRVLVREDDAEQHLNDNSVEIDSPDLDMVSGRVVGVRFDHVDIPKGSDIMNARIQFTATGVAGTGAVTFSINGEAADNAAAFAATNNNVTSRLATMNAVSWSPGDWNAGDAGADQLTADFHPVVKEIVDRTGWANGNALVLRIATTSGAGVRHAVAEDGDADKAPLLIVDFMEPTPTMVGPQDLPICVPPALNPNLMDGSDPTADDLANDCSMRVQETLSGLSAACGYPSACTCTAQANSRQYSATCDNPCTENPVDPDCSDFDPVHGNVQATNAPGDDPVCGANSPLAAEIFGQRTLCAVSGKAHIHVSGEDQKNPNAAGIVQFLGPPCPGQSCAVSMETRLDIGDVTFGNFFHSETFHDLAGLGETMAGHEAMLSDMGDGTFASDAGNFSAQGSRGSTHKALATTNDDPIDVTVLWGEMMPMCAVHGTLIGTVDPEASECDGGDNDGQPCMTTDDCPGDDCPDGHCDCKALPESDLTLGLDVEGDIHNQPPTANAGADQTVECVKAAVNAITLDGSASSDLDHNIALYSWLRHDRTGSEVGFQPVTHVQQALGTESYILRVIDDFGQADEDATMVDVADTTPPEVHCAVMKSKFTDNNHNLINVGLSASAQDQCEGTLPVSVQVFSDEDDQDPSEYYPLQDLSHVTRLFSPDAKNIGLGSLRLRSERNGNGDGRVYLIVTSATDSSDNVGVDCCPVIVPLYPGKPSLQAVTAQANAARAFCLANTGAAPPGYVVIGDGPVLGAKQ